MGIFDRLKKAISTAEKEEYESDLARESAKVRAYRAADEVTEASKALMKKALELRAEIEALANE